MGEGAGPGSASLPTIGTMLGTPMIGAVDHYLTKYGRAAGHEVVARVSPKFKGLLLPHAPMLGLVGSRRYPYPFLGELVRTMATVVRVADEDAFIRELSIAGIDAAVNTAMRVLLRIAQSPESLAARGQEAWNLFHDSGRITILSVTEHEYMSQVDQWPNHDVTVCKVVMEVRRRLIQRTGKRHVEARREKCVAWGHDACTTRVRWE